VRRHLGGPAGRLAHHPVVRVRIIWPRGQTHIRVRQRFGQQCDQVVVVVGRRHVQPADPYVRQALRQQRLTHRTTVTTAVGGDHQFHAGAVFVQSLEHAAGAERRVLRMRRNDHRSAMVLVGKGPQFRRRRPRALGHRALSAASTKRPSAARSRSAWCCRT
jgi:hypothetical protein